MPEFIYILHPTRPEMITSGPTDREKSVVGDHFAHLKALSEAGTAILAGRTTTEDDRVFGLCLLRAESEPVARALMVRDPAIAQGVMSAELFPFRIAIAPKESA